MHSPFYRTLRFWRQLHLWLGLLLCLQLLAWFAGGLVMAWLPIEEVRGQHLRQAPVVADWSVAQLSPAELLHRVGDNADLSASSLQLNQRHTLPVYQFSGDTSRYFSAIDGTELTALNSQEISRLAQQWYRGSATALPPILLTEIPLEARGLSAPVWQIQFQDAEHTRFYLDPVLGQLLRVRTDTWRLFDFVWMLHIMDYQERDNFNHPLLILASSLALFFTLSGLILLLPMLRRKYKA